MFAECLLSELYPANGDRGGLSRVKTTAEHKMADALCQTFTPLSGNHSLSESYNSSQNLI